MSNATETRFFEIGNNLAMTLLVLLGLATCAVVNATEDLARESCYEAGNPPAECDR